MADVDHVATSGNRSSYGVSWLVAGGQVTGGARSALPSGTMTRRRNSSDCSKGRLETHGCW